MLLPFLPADFGFASLRTVQPAVITQVNIRSWMDEEGYHWFRIEDNGTGMTKESSRSCRSSENDFR